MKRLPILAAILALSMLACVPAHAGPLVRLDVVDRDSGQLLPRHAHRREHWIAGSPGHRYGVRLTNTSGERVLVVLSVDGINAITGETADPAQSGYVLDPWQSAEINGWRKSHADVAQFVFTTVPDSYAARTGRPDNVGTIGVAVFRERARIVPRPMPTPPIARPHRGKATGEAAEAASAHTVDTTGARQQQRIGTGHGEREWSPSSHTRFERAGTRPAQFTQLRYDSPRALAALGILPRPTPPQRPRPPQAFPGQFTPDPPSAHWRR